MHSFTPLLTSLTTDAGTKLWIPSSPVHTSTSEVQVCLVMNRQINDIKHILPACLVHLAAIHPSLCRDHTGKLLWPVSVMALWLLLLSVAAAFAGCRKLWHCSPSTHTALHDLTNKRLQLTCFKTNCPVTMQGMLTDGVQDFYPVRNFFFRQKTPPTKHVSFMRIIFSWVQD